MSFAPARCAIITLFFGVFFTSPGHASEIIGSLKWNDNRETVEKALKPICSSVRKIDVVQPNFPLAKSSEVHLICNTLSLPNGTVDQAAFTLSDDKLTYVEVHGGVVKAIVGTSTEKPRTYLGLKVYRKTQLFIDEQKDTAWLLSKEALHPNLFTWRNPYLAHSNGYEQSAKAPPFLAFDKKYENLEAMFRLACPVMNVEQQEKPWLPSKPLRQFQVNCFGFEFAGFPRKIEAVFGDGKLALAWILTGKGEEARVRNALTNSYGQPIIKTEAWDVFPGKQVALRKDKPEVLMISKQLIPFLESQLEPKKEK